MELPSKKAANGITQACEIKFAKSTQRRFEISRCCLIYLLLLFCEQFTVSSSSENKICPDRQKAKLYAEGIVKCSIFHHIGIYWFMGTDEIHGNNAFIEKVSGVVDGDGYVSGEFDVLRDGSLKIFNVTHLHEGSFRVKVVDSQNSIQSFIIHLLVSDTERCPGIQEVQLHTEGIVMCNVVHHSEQVFWYNKAHGIDGGAAFIQMVDGEVRGVGYDSGEFDILHDGSLVINNVSRNHQGLFRVKTVDSRWMIHSHDVQLLVIGNQTCSPRSSEKDPNDTDAEIAQRGLPNTQILRFTPSVILVLLLVIFVIVRKRKAQRDQRHSVITYENDISPV